MNRTLKLLLGLLAVSATLAGVAVAASSPSASTGSATSVKSTSAVLNGTINPNGAATVYRFEYGLTNAYGSTTSIKSAGSGTKSVAVARTVSGLIPGTTYHYRLDALSKNDYKFSTLVTGIVRQPDLQEKVWPATTLEPFLTRLWWGHQVEEEGPPATATHMLPDQNLGLAIIAHGNDSICKIGAREAAPRLPPHGIDQAPDQMRPHVLKLDPANSSSLPEDGDAYGLHRVTPGQASQESRYRSPHSAIIACRAKSQ